jgi:hypothetical protein
MRICVLLLLLSATAGAAPLGATIARVPVDPPVVIVPTAAGKTPLERYRSQKTAASDVPLVLIARLADANAPDVIAVTRASKDDMKISIVIETRRYRGSPPANDAATMPLVEISLGALPKGTYTIDVDEQVSDFTKLGAPETAGKPHRGLQSSITLTIQ